MATKSISQLDTQATANETDLFEVAIVDANSASGYASKKESAAAIADAIVGDYQYPLRITGTTAKTIAGAINELKNLIDLLPQFAIEVVNSLPVSDISTTTIYLVPASDPEQGNYYEEYIYVNNAWELVGTTAVDLTGYYTSAQVDTLLAAKADSASLATVATSGAYADLSGKPTIDTALDTTSTNAVENRAVASEINSIKSDITVDGSASGDIATFVDGSANPLKELKISIEAVQSGSGDPSPTNVRPITGFSTVDITRTGKNLFDKNNVTFSAGVILNDGSISTIGSYIHTDNFINVKASTNYILSGQIISLSTYNSVAFYDESRAFVDRFVPSIFGINAAFTTPNNCRYIRFNAASDAYNVNTIQLEEGTTATTYESYNGNTYNIDWQSTAGTVYGGTLNVKTGELIVTHLKKLGSECVWQVQDISIHVYYTSSFNTIKKEGNTNIICDSYATSNATTVTNMNNLTIKGRASDGNIYIRNDNYTTLENFTSAVANVGIMFELKTPITYQLTPTEIRSLLGINNVWADCGAITELKYTRDLNLCINDIISRIEVLENASSSRSLSVSSVLTKSLTSELGETEGKTEEETEEETKEEAQNER